jgi:hypothetical protein
LCNSMVVVMLPTKMYIEQVCYIVVWYVVVLS